MKIEKSSPVYEVASYGSAAVDHLVIRAVGPGLSPFAWTTPDTTGVTPFLPKGEVL